MNEQAAPSSAVVKNSNDAADQIKEDTLDSKLFK